MRISLLILLAFLIPVNLHAFYAGIGGGFTLFEDKNFKNIINPFRNIDLQYVFCDVNYYSQINFRVVRLKSLMGFTSIEYFKYGCIGGTDPDVNVSSSLEMTTFSGLIELELPKIKLPKMRDVGINPFLGGGISYYRRKVRLTTYLPCYNYEFHDKYKNYCSHYIVGGKILVDLGDEIGKTSRIGVILTYVTLVDKSGRENKMIKLGVVIEGKVF